MDFNINEQLKNMSFSRRIQVGLKVVNFLTAIHKAQALNYLRASGNDVALILNFAKPRLEYKRVVS